jgi:type IV pilus assembly protein PilV
MSTQRRAARQEGMMLLEVMIGILIFAIGVLGMVKMRAIASANSVNSQDRTTAAMLADDLISELWITHSINQPTDYAAWQSRVTAALPGGSGSLTAGTSATNLAIVTIQWPRKLGRNIDFGAATASDSNATATYTTQVIIQ